MERAEAYAEDVINGKTLEGHELARSIFANLELGEERTAELERLITADMEVIAAWLRMAYAVGYSAGTEERHGRRLK
jgi:hypothetical protein